MNHSGPTLGFRSRAHFLAWMREQEGPEFFAGRTEQEVCDWFCATSYGPQVLSPVFRRSIRALLAGTRRRRCRVGRFSPEKNRRIFALPPSRFWPRQIDTLLCAEARRLPFLFVTTATEYHWRSADWRAHRSIFFYGDWAELRAAYQAARQLIAGKDASDGMRRVRWCFAGAAHGEQLGILLNTANLEACK